MPRVFLDVDNESEDEINEELADVNKNMEVRDDGQPRNDHIEAFYVGSDGSEKLEV